ncbi:MAG: chromate transporter [Ardenticatenales bacterium]
MEHIARLWSVLVTFTRCGVFGFGGGPSMIPLMQQEVVHSRGWLTDREFADLLAMGNALPGPITTKLAAVIGWRLAGPLGAAAGLIGMAVPTALLMMVVAATIAAYQDRPRAQGALAAARPAVVALLAWTALEVGRGTTSGLSTSALAWYAAILVGSLALLMFNVHPAIVVVTAALIGAVALA